MGLSANVKCICHTELPVEDVPLLEKASTFWWIRRLMPWPTHSDPPSKSYRLLLPCNNNNHKKKKASECNKFILSPTRGWDKLEKKISQITWFHVLWTHRANPLLPNHTTLQIHHHLQRLKWNSENKQKQKKRFKFYSFKWNKKNKIKFLYQMYNIITRLLFFARGWLGLKELTFKNLTDEILLGFWIDFVTDAVSRS